MRTDWLKHWVSVDPVDDKCPPAPAPHSPTRPACSAPLHGPGAAPAAPPPARNRAAQFPPRDLPSALYPTQEAVNRATQAPRRVGTQPCALQDGIPPRTGRAARRSSAIRIKNKHAAARVPHPLDAAPAVPPARGPAPGAALGGYVAPGGYMGGGAGATSWTTGPSCPSTACQTPRRSLHAHPALPALESAQGPPSPLSESPLVPHSAPSPREHKCHKLP